MENAIEKKSGTRNPFYELTREPVLMVGVLLVLAVLVLFVLYPLFVTLGKVIIVDGKLSGKVFFHVLTQRQNIRAIQNSILLGCIVATLSTAIGFVFAYALTKAKISGGKFFQSMAIFPMISPPFMFGLSVILLFGRSGLITDELLGLDTEGIYGLGGLIIVQTVGLFPIAYMTLSGILQGIDPDLETGSMNLGLNRIRTFFRITLPLALPGILAAWLLVFVLSLTDFGNPIIIGGDFTVLSVQAYLEFTGMGDLPRGAALSLFLLVPTVTVFFIQKYIMKNKTYHTITGKSSRRAATSVSKLARRTMLIFCSLVSAFSLLLYGTIILGGFVRLWGIDWTPSLYHIKYALDVGVDTLVSTLFLALVSTPITALLGMLIAFLVVRKSFPGKHFLEFLSMLSYAVPGTVVGIGYVLAFNGAPFKLSGTAFILVTCYVFRNVPIGVEGGIAALKQISKDIEESSRNLGATSTYTFRRITLPLIRSSFFASATYAFIRSMTAISAIIFLVSARWKHLTVLILAQTDTLRLGAASVLSFVLILVIVVFILIIMRVVGLKRSEIFGTSK